MAFKNYMSVFGIGLTVLMWVSCYSGPAYEYDQSNQNESQVAQAESTPEPNESVAEDNQVPDTNDSIHNLADSIADANFVSDHIASNQNLPTILLTNTSDGRSAETSGSRFTRELSAALLETRRISVAASPVTRQRLRVERLDQQYEAQEDSMARLGQETGAQFMLLAHEDATPQNQVREIDIEIYDVEQATIVYAARIVRPTDPQESPDSRQNNDESMGNVWQVRREFDDRTREEVLYFEAPAIRGDPRYYLSIVFRRNQNPDLSTLQVFMTNPLMGGASSSIQFNREMAYGVVHSFDNADPTFSVWIRDGVVIDPTIERNPVRRELIEADSNRVRPESAYDFANQILGSSVLRIEYERATRYPSNLGAGWDLTEDNRAVFDVSGLLSVMRQRGISEDEIQTAARNADF